MEEAFRLVGVNTVILVLAADADKTRAINRNYKQVGPNPEAALPAAWPNGFTRTNFRCSQGNGCPRGRGPSHTAQVNQRKAKRIATIFQEVQDTAFTDFLEGQRTLAFACEEIV